MSTPPLGGELLTPRALGDTPTARGRRVYFLPRSSHGEGEAGWASKDREKVLAGLERGEQGLDEMSDRRMRPGSPGKTGEACSEKHHRTNLAWAKNAPRRPQVRTMLRSGYIVVLRGFIP